MEYLTNHLTELNEIWHMGVFESAFQHGDVSSGVRGTILVSHTKTGKKTVPNGNISQIAWPNCMKFGIWGFLGMAFNMVLSLLVDEVPH